MTPMFDRLIVRRDDAVAQTKAGIIIHESAREVPNTGVVLAAGEGRICPATMGHVQSRESGMTTRSIHVEPLRVKVGDHILFHAYAGSDISDPVTKEPLIFIQEDDVIAILDMDYINAKRAEAEAKQLPAVISQPADPVAPAEESKGD